LKPENIVIDPTNKICIVDFGIALLEGARRVTWRFGTNPFGTPDYMAPEQIQGKRGDARTDIYALGIIFFELLTGSVPFRGDNPLAIMNQHLTAVPESPRKLNRAIPPGIEAIILKAIRRDPDERYQSADAMLQDLQHYNELDLPSFVSGADKVVRGTALTDRQIWVMSGIIAISFLVIAVLVVLIVFLVKHH
jgi:serine/threonine protein kinase